MDEQEACEWLLKRRGGFGISGIDPPDWGTDLADSLATVVLAKATYERRKMDAHPHAFGAAGICLD